MSLSTRALSRLGLLLLLAGGCMADPKPAPKPPETTPPDPVVVPVPPPPVVSPPPDLPGPFDPDASDVTLARTERYLTPAGEVVRAEAVGEDVEALVFDGARYLRYPPAAAAPGAGRVVIPGVPEGEYLLRTGTRYVLTSARRVELGDVRASRPDVELIAEGSSPARVSVSGLHPWNAEAPAEGGDALYVAALEAGGIGLLDLQPAPARGETAVSDADASLLPLRAPRFPRLRGDGTDTLVVSHVAVRTGSVSYRSVRAAATLAAPAFDGTAPLALSAALQPLPQQALRVDLRGSDFAAHAAGVHPQARLVDTHLLVHTAPYGLAYSWVGPSTGLLSLIQPAGTESNRVLDLEFGDPFPATWGRVGVALSRYGVTLTLPSGRTTYANGFVSHEDELSRLVRSPVAPDLLHARALRVDGADGSLSGPLASLAPTLTWEPPAVGAPTAYTLQVLRLSDPGGIGTVGRSVRAEFVLPASARSLRLPEGVLEPGGHYVFGFTAWRAPTWDFAHHPNTYGFPNSTATRVSGLLTAP